MATVPVIDLTAGDVKVIGNRGDTHLFRLHNPDGQQVISVGGEYEAEFVPPTGKEPDSITLDVSEIADGWLTLPATIKSGTYLVRRLNPRRTLLKLEVEVQ